MKLVPDSKLSLLSSYLQTLLSSLFRLTSRLNVSFHFQALLLAVS